MASPPAAARALANWLADPANPLTTRVMVNRIWHYHFGRGIVGTPSDFGIMGERPANKELLEYLTATFVESGWSIKKMHRLIMLSNTYQQSSKYNAAAAKVDPEDKLVWRYNRHRLEGEVIRDSMLEVSGLLNLKMRGRGVFPPLPPGVVDARRMEDGTRIRPKTRAPQRLHLRAAQHALSDVRSLRHAGHA